MDILVLVCCFGSFQAQIVRMGLREDECLNGGGRVVAGTMFWSGERLFHLGVWWL